MSICPLCVYIIAHGNYARAKCAPAATSHPQRQTQHLPAMMPTMARCAATLRRIAFLRKNTKSPKSKAPRVSRTVSLRPLLYFGKILCGECCWRECCWRCRVYRRDKRFNGTNATLNLLRPDRGALSILLITAGVHGVHIIFSSVQSLERTKSLSGPFGFTHRRTEGSRFTNVAPSRRVNQYIANMAATTINPWCNSILRYIRRAHFPCAHIIRGKKK